MAYRVLVTDIDGTLLHPGRHRLSDACSAALAALREKGVGVIMATGRAALACGPQVFSGFTPDYLVCANSACILDSRGKTVHEDRFSLRHIEALTRYAEQEGYALCFSFEDSYYAYTEYERYRERYRANWGDAGDIRDGTAQTRHLQSMPYAGFVLMPAEAAAGFRRLYPDIRLVEVSDGAYDVCKADNNKAKGLELLFDRLGIDWADAVAVGDGDNDVEMLEKAGLGVAMGNGTAGAKAAASHITASVLDDGVLDVIRDFF